MPPHCFLSSSYLTRGGGGESAISRMTERKTSHSPLTWEKTYCQTSVTSVGATCLSSIWIIAKPPTAYREPLLLTRLTELLSWGNSVKGSHLRRPRRSSLRWSSMLKMWIFILIYRNFLNSFYTINSILCQSEGLRISCLLTQVSYNSTKMLAEVEAVKFQHN